MENALMEKVYKAMSEDCISHTQEMVKNYFIVNEILKRLMPERGEGLTNALLNARDATYEGGFELGFKSAINLIIECQKPVQSAYYEN